MSNRNEPDISDVSMGAETKIIITYRFENIDELPDSTGDVGTNKTVAEGIARSIFESQFSALGLGVEDYAEVEQATATDRGEGNYVYEVTVRGDCNQRTVPNPFNI